MTAQQHNDELAIIGCCLLGGLDTSIEAVEKLNPECFDDLRYRDVFNVIESLATAGTEVNYYTLLVKWGAMNSGPIPAEIETAQELVPSALNLPYYLEAVIEAWRKRRIKEGATTLLTKCKNPQAKADALLADAETFLYADELKNVTVNSGRDSVGLLTDDLQRRYNLAGKLSGIETGFYRFDKLTDGLQYGEQTIIGARPSMGKTAIGLNIINFACLKHAIPTVFVSLEMSTAAVMRRLLSGWLQMPMHDIKRGSYTQEQFQRFTAFNAHVAKCPLWIVDGVGGLEITKLCASVRRLCRKHGIKLVVVDYLQKIKPAEKHEKRTYEVGDISGKLRGLAVQTGASFLTLAQLNREGEKDKGRHPKLADLADSGQIERDADTVALIHRDRSDPSGKTQLIIAKQRDGETGIVDLVFSGEFCQFENAPI